MVVYSDDNETLVKLLGLHLIWFCWTEEHTSHLLLDFYYYSSTRSCRDELLVWDEFNDNSCFQKTMTWAPWFWYQSVVVGSKTLEVCDYLGESLASFFGITTPKYEFEIEHHKQMVAEVRLIKIVIRPTLIYLTFFFYHVNWDSDPGWEYSKGRIFQ